MRRDDAFRDRFDLFPKISDDFARRTATGGAIATIGLALMVILFLQQTAELMRTTTAYDLRVDDGVAGATKKIVINVDLTLRAMHCAQVSLDAMDVTGETRLDVSRNEVRTTRVDARGRAIAMTSERTAVNAKTEAGGAREGSDGREVGVRGLLRRGGGGDVLRRLRLGARGVSRQGMGAAGSATGDAVREGVRCGGDAQRTQGGVPLFGTL